MAPVQKPVLSAYAPVPVEGMNWAILAEIEVDEAFAAANALSTQILGITAAVAAILIILATTVSRPIL